MLIVDIDSILDNNLKVVIEALIKNKANVYLVGGAIRDYYLGYPINDYDLEVYDIEYAQLLELFKDKITYTNDYFRCVKLNNIEIALPRQEVKVGSSYNQYKLSFNDIKPKQAMLRRDFSINSLMYNCKTKQVEDYLNAIEDLENKVLRANNLLTFNDDSTRVLRLMKYMNKYQLSVDKQTWQIACAMSSELWCQPKIICANYFKDILAIRNINIENFFKLLKDFLIVEQLKNKESFNKHHPEKTLYNHVKGTLLVLQLLNIESTRDFRILFIALLFHDYGKLYEDANHVKSSLSVFDIYKDYFLLKAKEQNLVRMLIEDHMVYREYAQKNEVEKMKILKQKYRNQFYLLELVGICDYAGRVVDFDEDEFKLRIKWFKANVVTCYWR